MKAVILAGGLGTRISEETTNKPKPMIEVGGKPIIWHIMKTYSHYGINDFVICCGYKGYVIKEYFMNYFIHNSDIQIDVKSNEINVYRKQDESWKISLIDTGENTMTGGRLRRVIDLVKNEDSFCFTYGDGVANINISQLIEFHKSHGKLATLTAAFPPGRFGALDIKDGSVLRFKEKPRGDNAMINAGYFVLSPSVIDYINNDSTVWEQEPLNTLSEMSELMAYEHHDFWHPMDTLRDKVYLEKLWSNNSAPWRVW